MADLAQLERALVNADAAGDADAAKVFASEIIKMRSAAPRVTDSPVKIGADAFPDALRETLRGTDWGTRNIAGAGTALSDIYQGAKQFIGMGDKQAIDNNKIIQSEAPVGAFAGNVALTAIPFGLAGNSLKAAGAVGAGFGALQPVEGAQTLSNIAQGKGINTAIGGATGVAGQAVANKAGDWLTNKLATLATTKAKNSVIDQTLQDSINAGYSIPPSMMPDSGMTSRVLEGISGKYKTNQLAGIRNQNITDTLARKAVGLGDDVPLTSEVMQGIRKSAYESGYAPVAQVGMVKTDETFIKALDNLVSGRKMASNSFPNAVKDEVTPTIEALKVGNFDAGEALQMTQILRDEANAAYRAGDTALGKAKKGAAKAIEDQIERSLSEMGQDGAGLLKGFRDARTLMAKAHTVEDAIQEGGGKVNAMKLASRVQAGKPMTGELATIGNFANNFGKNQVGAIPQAGNANPLTALDFMYGGTIGAFGGGIGAFALPAARVASRYGLLSPVAQRAISRPEYSLGMLPRVSGGLLQYAPVGGTVLGLDAFGQ